MRGFFVEPIPTVNFQLLITAGPDQPASAHALATGLAILDSQHCLYRVFLQNEGVLNLCPDNPLDVSWQGLLQHTDCVACSNSVAHFGLSPDEVVKRGATIAGLALLVEGSVRCERMLTFGQRL